MKRAIKSHGKLNPLDVNKDVLLHIVCQWKNPDNESLGVNIISCDSATFKRCKRSYSPFEVELAALHWCVTKEDFFTRGARKILANWDAKSMAAFLEQDLEKIDR